MPTKKGGPRPQRAAEKKAAEPKPKKAAPKKAPQPVEPTPQPVAPEEPGKTPRRNALFPLGVNYYPLDSEIDSWDDWYSRDVAEDFATFAKARLSIVRIFLSWKVLEPQVGQYDEEAVERIQDILDAAREHKLQVIVCFFGDDRHAEMVDVPWGKKRDARTDSYLIQREVALVQKIVNRFRSDTAVFAWDLANEAFCSAFESADAFSSWVSELREAVREVDTDHAVIVSVDPETLFRSTGVDPRASLVSAEFGVSHVTAAYRAYAAEGPITSGPTTYLDSFLLRSALLDMPALLDDAGVLALDNNAAEEAIYLRTVLWSGIMNRASGAILRRWKDLETERREPYYVDPFEMLVGVCDAEGRPKPSLAEVSAFARVSARIDLRRYQLQSERTAIIIPAERYEPLPNLAGLYDPRACLMSYMGAKEAHVPVTVARETDELGAFSVIIVPSVFTLSAAAWDKLAVFVQNGGSLVLSYGGGDAHPSIRNIFGMEFLGDGGPRKRLDCRVAQADILGALKSFDSVLSVSNFALLGAGGATIVATDAKGSPLLTVNQYGQGRAIYVAAPIERAIAQGDPWTAPAAVRNLLRTVYGAVASAAGCGAQVNCDVPEVEVALFQGEADDILLLLNHAPTAVTANLTTERRVAGITDVRGGQPVAVGGVTFGVPLEPNGTAALRLSYA